ncbi:MAG: 30S ribosomal protein S8 [bacterium]|nr:30S ribosomal protein S8 [bacterium]
MDSIANVITIIRNGYLAKLKKVTVPLAKQNLALCEVLKNQRFISDYSSKDLVVTISLRYVAVPNSLTKVAALTGIQRISKPSLRIYNGATKLPRFRGNLGVLVVSTNQGLMTAKEARQKNVGGEVLCKVW